MTRFLTTRVENLLGGETTHVLVTDGATFLTAVRGREGGSENTNDWETRVATQRSDGADSPE